MTFLPYGQGLHIQVNNLATTGRLYEFFDEENLKRIQNVVQHLSGHNGDWWYKELDKRKNALIAGEQVKPETVSFINFADTKVYEIRRDLVTLLQTFKKS